MEGHQVFVRRYCLQRHQGDSPQLCSIPRLTLFQAGYRLFDGASDYGNEKEAGEGVKRALKDGLVKREDLCKFTPPIVFSTRLT
jgi:hypothetical protein